MGGETGTPDIPYCRSLSLLGERAAGTLYAADSDRYGGAVTVTVYPRPADDRQRSRFESAAETARRLGAHPNIVTIHASGHTDDGQPYVVSDGHARTTAQGVVATSGVLGVDSALPIGIVLAGALETAHRAGVIHGGVAPGVVLLQADGQPLLTEVGLSDFARPQGASAALARWIPYHAPPEILEGTDVSPATDVYSLASVVYTLLVGQPPHAGTGVDDSTASLLLRILQMPMPTIERSDVPPGLEDALRTALSHSPAKRPQHALELAWAMQDAQRMAGLEVTEPVVLDLASGVGGGLKSLPAGPATPGLGGAIGSLPAGPVGSGPGGWPGGWPDSQPAGPGTPALGGASGSLPAGPVGSGPGGWPDSPPTGPGTPGPGGAIGSLPAGPGPQETDGRAGSGAGAAGSAGLPGPGGPAGTAGSADGGTGAPKPGGLTDGGRRDWSWLASVPPATPGVPAAPGGPGGGFGSPTNGLEPADGGTGTSVFPGVGDHGPPRSTSGAGGGTTSVFPASGTGHGFPDHPGPGPTDSSTPGPPTWDTNHHSPDHPGPGPADGSASGFPMSGTGYGAADHTAALGRGDNASVFPSPGYGTDPSAGVGQGDNGSGFPATNGAHGGPGPTDRGNGSPANGAFPTPWWATPPSGGDQAATGSPSLRPDGVDLGPLNRPTIDPAALGDALTRRDPSPGQQGPPADSPLYQPLPSDQRPPIDTRKLGEAFEPGRPELPAPLPNRPPARPEQAAPALPQARQAPTSPGSPAGGRRRGRGDQTEGANPAAPAEPAETPSRRSRRGLGRDHRRPADRTAGTPPQPNDHGTTAKQDQAGGQRPSGGTGGAPAADAGTNERAESALERARQARLERQRRERERDSGASDGGSSRRPTGATPDTSTARSRPPALPVIVLVVVVIVLGLGGAWMVVSGQDSADPVPEDQTDDGASSTTAPDNQAFSPNRASDITAVETATGVQLDWEGPVGVSYLVRILSPTEPARPLGAGPATALLIPPDMVQPGGAYCFDVVAAPEDGAPPVSVPEDPSQVVLPTACIGGTQPEAVVRP